MKRCQVQLGLRQAEDDISAPGAFRLHRNEHLSIRFQGHEIGMNDEFAEVDREALVWRENAPTTERFMAVRKQPGHATLTEEGVRALDHCWLVEPRPHAVRVVRSYRCRSAGHRDQPTTRQWPRPRWLPTLRRWKMPEQPDARGAELPLGLYEQLVTRQVARLQDELHERAPTRPLLSAEGPQYLTEHVARAVSRALRAPGIGGDPQRQVQLCNELLDLVAREVPDAVTYGNDSVARAALLLAILEQPTGLTPVRRPQRPETPLAQDALFVHAPHEPNLAAELATELESADRVDLICAFIVWSGIRIFLDVLRSVRARGVPIRVLTTTYTGITEPRALDALRDLGADIKVSYDVGVTRLHAKAWLVWRRSGFSTAYVGSSNITHTALHEGLEWNVRLTQAASPELIDRFDAAFQTYWDDPQFEPYDPDRFAAAVNVQRRPATTPLLLFDIRPYPFQEQILERLDAERTRHGRWRNLIVAATGTGKTVLSAFDYRRLQEQLGPLRLLFVAHRREILEQSLGTFRAVLHDGSFGDLYLGGGQFTNTEHIFASIQALSRLDLERELDPKHFDMVIVDEFHHAEAPTYRRLLEHVQPRVLLGLTATPERADRQDVTRWFDGRIAAELRLWDALQQGLLCPFQYFGLADDVDLSGVRWQRGGYDQEALSSVYTGNDARVLKILRGLREYVADPSRMRALGFAVSVEHAEYMARRFNDAGIPAAHLSGDSSSQRRSAVLHQLRRREINIIFSVDLFNEGLDIPEIDTVLFLRPTESATVFLQQLGRGLRRFRGKSGLTVLDFIGQQHRAFRFEPRLAALTRTRGHQLIREIQAGFPSLPPGCSMQLDRVASATIIDNIRSALAGLRRANLVNELRSLGDIPLFEFVRATGHTLDEVYRSGSGWTDLRRLAGFAGPPGPEEGRLQRAIGRMQHIDDPERVGFYTEIVGASSAPETSHFTVRQQRLLTMLHFDLWGRERTFVNLDASLQRFWLHPDVRQELLQLLAVLEDRSASVPLPAGLAEDVPVWAHQRYTRDEVLGAFGDASVERPPTSREGVRYIQGARTDVFFVTLQKVAGRFSPSTMYRDYAISPNLFHWESQSITTETSPTGRRYVRHSELGSSICIFARESSESTPFVFLGNATYIRHERERPMQITWRLDHPMPSDFFLVARAAA